jgi:uncharacterized protein (UPF0212 family)
LEEDSFPTIVVVEDTSVVSDADTPTALADVTADRASKDCDYVKVPLVTDACPACVLCKEEPFGGNPEEIRLPTPAT